MAANPTIDGVERILVVGSGAMGSQIGAVCALAGYEVVTSDVQQTALERSRADIAGRVARLVEKGRLSQDDADAALARMTYTTDSAEAAATADLVIEAASERLDVKRAIFADLDAAAPEHAILATNSSTIPSSQLVDATSRPDRVCNVHFFNPALVMKCVEIVRNPLTSDATIDTVTELVRRIGKNPVRLNHEVPGFIANRLMGAIRDEALRLHEQGVASIEDIDEAARSGLNHPMGPFELMDLVGLDVTEGIMQATYDLSGDERERPNPEVQRLVADGRLGRKSGRGWFEYPAK